MMTRCVGKSLTAGTALSLSMAKEILAEEHLTYVKSVALGCILSVFRLTTLHCLHRRRLESAAGQTLLKAQLEVQLAT